MNRTDVDVCETCGRTVPSDEEVQARQQAQAMHPRDLQDIPFPYALACQAIRACRETATMLEGDLELRPDMVASLSDWSGGYRDDYDRTWPVREGALNVLRQGLDRLADEIGEAWDAADGMNSRRAETRSSDYDPRDYDSYHGR